MTMTENGFIPQRGCGFRHENGIYSCLKAGANGKPIEYFMIDHPRAVPKELDLVALGVQLIECNGTWHIFDIVGSEDYYEYVPDFIEEGIAFLRSTGVGFSRRLPKTLDFSKLTLASKHFLIHKRARIKNGQELFEKSQDFIWDCPKKIPCHDPYEWIKDEQMYDKPCIGKLWENRGLYNDTYGKRDIQVEMPCEKSYACRTSPKGFVPEWEYGIFAWFPISIQCIRGNLIEQLKDLLSKTEIPVEFTEI